jgi:hypothetical protein
MKDGSAFSQLEATIFINGKNENLKDIPYQNGPQSMYDKILEQTASTEIDGMIMRDKLAEVMSSKYYKEAIYGTKGLGSKGTKGAIIAKVINLYRNKAKSEIPEFMELQKQSEISKVETIKSQLIETKPTISKNSLERFRDFNKVFTE